MEATNLYGNALAEYLYDSAHDVSAINPASIKSFAQGKLLLTKNR
jgi:transposase